MHFLSTIWLWIRALTLALALHAFVLNISALALQSSWSWADGFMGFWVGLALTSVCYTIVYTTVTIPILIVHQRKHQFPSAHDVLPPTHTATYPIPAVFLTFDIIGAGLALALALPLAVFLAIYGDQYTRTYGSTRTYAMRGSGQLAKGLEVTLVAIMLINALLHTALATHAGIETHRLRTGKAGVLRRSTDAERLENAESLKDGKRNAEI